MTKIIESGYDDDRSSILMSNLSIQINEIKPHLLKREYDLALMIIKTLVHYIQPLPDEVKEERTALLTMLNDLKANVEKLAEKK